MAALVLTGCQSAEQSVSHERLVRFFDDLVFGTDYGFERPEAKVIRKWNEPIRVSILAVGDRHAMAAAHVRRFADMTQTDVEILEVPERTANFEINFVSTEEFLVNREYVPCFAASGHNEGSIKRARIVVSTADAGMVDSCIAHELMHAFGFPHHSGVIGSIMSPLHGVKEMTPWDEIALRALYDERLRPGMARKEAMPIAGHIIRDVMSRSAVARLGAN